MYYTLKMGTVIELKQKINDSYNDLKSLVDQKLVLVDEKIKLSKILNIFNRYTFITS